jgi:hypothetical protein
MAPRQGLAACGIAAYVGNASAPIPDRSDPSIEALQMLKEGDKAPDFDLPSDTGKKIPGRT